MKHEVAQHLVLIDNRLSKIETFCKCLRDNLASLRQDLLVDNTFCTPEGESSFERECIHIHSSPQRTPPAEDAPEVEEWGSTSDSQLGSIKLPCNDDSLSATLPEGKKVMRGAVMVNLSSHTQYNMVHTPHRYATLHGPCITHHAVSTIYHTVSTTHCAPCPFLNASCTTLHTPCTIHHTSSRSMTHQCTHHIPRHISNIPCTKNCVHVTMCYGQSAPSCQ